MGTLGLWVQVELTRKPHPPRERVGRSSWETRQSAFLLSLMSHPGEKAGLQQRSLCSCDSKKKSSFIQMSWDTSHISYSATKPRSLSKVLCEVRDTVSAACRMICSVSCLWGPGTGFIIPNHFFFLFSFFPPIHSLGSQEPGAHETEGSSPCPVAQR